MSAPAIPSPLPTPSTISLFDLQALLPLYPLILAHLALTKRKTGPKTLPQLDELRYKTLPAKVHSRRTAAPSLPTAASRKSPDPQKEKAGDESGLRASDPHGWLEKEEVEDLMAWKITRGSFRPTLLPLLRTNSASFIQTTTSAAFTLFALAPRDPFPALKKLAELKGVGPATASLILSVAELEVVPFFADEVLLWLRGEGGKGKKGLKYDFKEYREVWEGVGKVREGLGVGAAEVERGLWVVGMLGDVGVRGALESLVEDEEEGKEAKGSDGDGRGNASKERKRKGGGVGGGVEGEKGAKKVKGAAKGGWDQRVDGVGRRRSSRNAR